MDSENQPVENQQGTQRVQSVPYHPREGRADAVVISFHLLIEAFEHTRVPLFRRRRNRCRGSVSKDWNRRAAKWDSGRVLNRKYGPSASVSTLITAPQVQK